MPSSNKDFLRDRRWGIRHKVELTLKHRIWKSTMPEQTAQAVDLSERGIQFISDCLYAEGETVELRFEMPEPVAGEPASEWLCTGHVVRVKPIGSLGKSQVAVQFDCHEVARQKEHQCGAL